MTLSEFEQFCLRYQAEMFAVAQKVLRDVQGAEDAVLETATRIFKTYRQLTFASEQEEHVFALLTAQNTAHDILRSRSARIMGRFMSADLCAVTDSCGTDTKPPRTAQEMVSYLMERLPLQQRTILRYRMMGLTFEEISATLNISPKLARTLAHQARTQMSDALEKEGFQLE